MREIALAVGNKNKDMIESLYPEVQSKLDFCKTIITTYADNNFMYLLIAFDEGFSVPCEKILKEIIINYIEENYKVDYLLKKIKTPKNTLAYQAYIKVLALFDKTTDVSALDKIIVFNQTFFLDSFLDFRLNPLKTHWNNLVSLSMDNISLLNSSTFVDIIKFLINTMENNVYKVKVVCSGDSFRIYNIANKNAKVKKVAECVTSIDLITKVLNSCPSYVDVYLENESLNEGVSFLSNVFTNRLKIFMKV